ncbi:MULTISPECIES: winged helix-turn-helix domain-containing protein [unclassified Streptomyces]|uniref:winged helix-turn-helix domain-containing protein n=1 Tax=unclassified Streptomyces TaxID=2593676 RepID=UPI002259D9D5|nr:MULTISPECIES: winged helix-turn-helix domain-containing protein [unclassified Streptomyces]WSP55475.1 winged helix-turn-helix domain-containing protein [Streptomyces sp. NBC_01241]WSU23796.1 winged helix-turn-helix domain-containing protein [Streptomyces sp. NBC_01108]MCX4787161.1 winged helix-turn-helix domain-containing protein [Streptomyces sp. NBC_01221]MCX4797056.1 winged helix-turn-helix domain-containing protein [Streptomyces sp. NBC_01242]WSJ38362.1 winged helix-turn-helix domain-co
MRTAPAPVAPLSPMLQRLAAERATGALMRDRGTLYLAEGQVVHAESPATPGIDVLLTTGGGLHRDGWWEAVARAGAGQRVGRYLVDSGRVAGGALELCHLGALYDAAFFALAPTRTPARFRYGVSHWIGPVRPVPVDAVQRETLRRRELLERIWPDAAGDSAPLVRTDHSVDAPVPPGRRRVLDLVDGARTASDIAQELGRPAFHVLVALRRLAAAGLVEAVREPPAATTPGRIAIPEVTADPDVALLRRLRDALEAL